MFLKSYQEFSRLLLQSLDNVLKEGVPSISIKIIEVGQKESQLLYVWCFTGQ